jgi:hypothetical protein
MAPAPPILSTTWLFAGAKYMFLSIKLPPNDEITERSKSGGSTHRGQICINSYWAKISALSLGVSWSCPWLSFVEY